MGPIGNHWFKFAYVNLGFITIIAIMVYYISMKEIKQNWSKYRCNPMFLPLSDNIMGDFQQCVSSVQNLSMDKMMSPLTQKMDSNNQAIADTQQKSEANSQSMTNIFNSITTMSNMFNAVFNNSVIELQRLTYGIKDTMSKMVGISAALMYVLQANANTFGSAWAGPPGQTMRKLALLGHCFHPDTKVKLHSGGMVEMKNIQPGDILEDGSNVIANMKIDNTVNVEPLMKIKTEDPNHFIYVTGSHLIKLKNHQKFVKVCQHPDALLQNTVKSTWYSCLITNTHHIKIGSHIFWDWEDYYCKFT